MISWALYKSIHAKDVIMETLYYHYSEVARKRHYRLCRISVTGRGFGSRYAGFIEHLDTQEEYIEASITSRVL